ncbi:DUF4339 domain-containing protein [Lacipirellula parvula]|uniref:GYF domain-containing protein n=1 Tax=Lacipirellula parvula TaxID=2650471 RepID=A0A5K7X363_9BACT|nr:DUF4339 domain-containing protein [Lacipirellula parvula]BBO31094.1 hypothetical protein PLANPX_0706 [Lacipirellula parvula]
MPNWFVTMAGTELGPLTDAQLRQLASQGKLGREDHIRKEGIAAATTAGNIQGLFLPPNPPPPPIVLPEKAGTFSEWYGEHAGRWEVPFQVLAWIFYGFLWIPAWWGWALWNHQELMLQTKGKRVLGLVAAGFAVLLVFAAAGRANRPPRAATPMTSSPVNESRITPEMSAQAELLRQQVASSPTAQMTVDQFRQEILGRDFIPKQSFYEKYGRPIRMFTVADDTYLTYKCREGFVTVKCPAGPFQYQDDIAPVAVDER